MSSIIINNRIKKGKAKLEEVQATLTSALGKEIPIEVDWDFTKEMHYQFFLPPDAQRKLVEQGISDIICQCLVGDTDSLITACKASAAAKSFVNTISKIMWAYDYADSIASPVGAPFMAISVDSSKTLQFKLNMVAIDKLNDGDWGIVGKIAALVPGSGLPAAKAYTAAPVAAPATGGAPAAVKVEPKPVSAPVTVAPVPVVSSPSPTVTRSPIIAKPEPREQPAAPPAPVPSTSSTSELQPCTAPAPMMSKSPAVPDTSVAAKLATTKTRNMDAEIAAEEGFKNELDGPMDGFAYNGGITAGIDYESFIHTKEFKAQYHATNYSCLGADAVPMVRSIERAVNALWRTADVPSDEAHSFTTHVKKLSITLDVHSTEKTPLLQWNEGLSTLFIIHSFKSFNHPETKNPPRGAPLNDYIRGLEYILGFTVAKAKKNHWTGVSKSILAEFGTPALPITLSQRNPEFRVPAEPSFNKDPAMSQLVSEVVPSIFLGDSGLKYLTSRPPVRAVLHHKVKAISVIVDGTLAPQDNAVEFVEATGEVVVRVGLENTVWTTGLGPRLATLLGVNSFIDQEAIDDANRQIAGYTTSLRSLCAKQDISISFDWKHLQADQTFKTTSGYLDAFIKVVPERLNAALEHTKSDAEYDGSLSHYIRVEKLSLAGITEIIFRMSTTNQVKTRGQFGLFTPEGYQVLKEGSKLVIFFNSTTYPVGVGATVEWVLDPTKAQARQQRWVEAIGKREYDEEMSRRAQQVAEVKAENDKRARYDEQYQQYLRDMDTYRTTPRTYTCPQCRGNGRYNGSARATMECAMCSGGSGVLYRDVYEPTPPKKLPPLPIPTFPAYTLDAAKIGLNRGHLRSNHFVEGIDDL